VWFIIIFCTLSLPIGRYCFVFCFIYKISWFFYCLGDSKCSAGALSCSTMTAGLRCWELAVVTCKWHDMMIWYDMILTCLTYKFSSLWPFQCSALAVWNSLPKTVLSTDSVLLQFLKSRLKAFLFSRAFFFSAHWRCLAQRLWSYD